MCVGKPPVSFALGHSYLEEGSKTWLLLDAEWARPGKDGRRSKDSACLFICSSSPCLHTQEKCKLAVWCSTGRYFHLEGTEKSAGLVRSSRGGLTPQKQSPSLPWWGKGGRERECGLELLTPPSPKPCLKTQMDFMDEQCSATNVKPLYLPRQLPSFYKWVSAASYAKGILVWG